MKTMISMIRKESITARFKTRKNVKSILEKIAKLDNCTFQNIDFKNQLTFDYDFLILSICKNVKNNLEMLEIIDYFKISGT